MSDSLEAVGLGTFLDPHNPKYTNQDALDGVLARATDFEALEQEISSISGRWILLVANRNEARVYTDAAGTKPAYFFVDVNDALHVASTPALLSAVGLVSYDKEVVCEFEKYKNSGSWPIYETAYPGVRQIIPNHYLDRRDAVHGAPC